MKKFCILVFLFTCIVLNAQNIESSDKVTKKENITSKKEIELKKQREENIKKEVEKLRKLLMAEQNKK